MARARFQNLESEKREAILAAAADEFAERGYEGASLNQIIEDAGISKGSLYYYFDDKEDLFLTVWKTAIDRLMEEVGPFDVEALTAESFWDAFRDWTRRSLDYVYRNEWYVKVGRAFVGLRSDPQASDAVREMLEWARDLTRSILQRGQALGVVRRDLPLTLLVDILMAVDAAGDRWFVEHWDTLPEDELKRLADAELDLIRDMLDAENEGWED